MKKNVIILLVSLIFVSCSKKTILYSNISKPTFNYYKKEIKKSYNNDLNKTFYNKKEWIEDGLFLLEREIKIREKVLDSLKFIEKDGLIIEKNSANYSGPAKYTFIFINNDVYFYKTSENFKKEEIYDVNVVKYDKETLFKENIDLKEIYNFSYLNQIIKFKVSLNPYEDYLFTKLKGNKIDCYFLNFNNKVKKIK